MKKFVRPFLIILPILIILWVLVLYWQGKNQTHLFQGSQNFAPERMLKMGPVVGGATWTQNIGDVTIQMKASRLWVKKSKTFGFDNALFKKIAANDFMFSLSKKDKTLLSVSKDHLEMPMDQSKIKISNPRVLYPSDLAQVDSIIFDRESLSLQIRRKGSQTEFWNLEKM